MKIIFWQRIRVPYPAGVLHHIGDSISDWRKTGNWGCLRPGRCGRIHPRDRLCAGHSATMGELDTIVVPLVEVLQFWKSLPLTIIFTGHCLFCASLAPQLKDKYLVHYLLTFLWGNGGGVLSALLIMNPERAPLAFFAKNEIMVIWTICWWLVNYLPGEILGSLQQRWYIKMWTKGCTSLLRALLIINRVDLAVTLFPGVVAAPLLLGTVAGCGGRLLADVVLTSWGHSPQSAELSQPGFVSRSGFMAAAAYYVAAYVLAVLPAQAVAGVVVTALVAHSLLADVSGRPLDFTEPVAQLVHTCSCVPVPGAAASAGTSAKPSAGPVRQPRKQTAAATAAGGASKASTAPKDSISSTPGKGKQQQKAVELSARAGGQEAAAAAIPAVAAATPPRTRRRAAARKQE